MEGGVVFTVNLLGYYSGERVEKRVLEGQNQAAQKIYMEYFSFQGGDFRPLPLLQKYNTVAHYTGHPCLSG